MAKNLNLFLNYRDRQLKKNRCAMISVKKKKTMGEIQEAKQVESYRIWEVSCTD